ncbi:MAG: hypothetical protein ACI4AD_04760 [Roseburia sp.]
MQKLKNSIVDRMIAEQLTNKEIDFMLYLSRYQDESGKVCGVHYKALCEDMNMSYQEFYNVKESLQEKGFIRCVKANRIDHDITIINNEEQSCIREGYINTNHNIFREKEFYQLKAGAKLLAMFLMKVTRLGKGHFEIGVRKFYDEEDGYQKKFGVTVRVLRSYLMQLKMFFSIGIKAGKYYVTPKKVLYRKDGEKSESRRLAEYNTEVILRRARIKTASQTERKDTADLFKQYGKRMAQVKADALSTVAWAIDQSLAILNAGKTKKEIRKLSPKLIHKILKQRVEQLEAQLVINI